MRNSNKIFYIFIFLLVFIFLCLCIVSYVGIFEDAFISFRYAKNLAAGQGLVFNVGEHVWGYSNFFWTVLLALGVVCGFSIVAFAKYLGVLAAIFIIIALFYWLLSYGSDNSCLAFAGSLFLITSTHFLIASQNGLETVFFSFLVFLGILFFIDAILKEKSFPWYSLCFLLASMTRPEGPLFIVVAGFIEIIFFIRFRKKIFLKRLALAGLVFSVGYVTYILSMYAYYDALLPNAFFVKVNLSSNYQIMQGLNYLLSFLSDVRAGFLFWPLLFILTDRQRSLQNLILILFSATYLLFVIRVGGDFQVYFYRFIIPVLPLLFLLLSNGLVRMYELLQGLCPRYVNLISTVIICSLISINFFAVRSPVIPFFSQSAKRTPIVVENLSFLLRHPGALKNKVSEWFSPASTDIQPMDMVGRVLDEMLEPGVSVATGQCGQIPFYLQSRRVLDMIGLMDDEVAHRRMSLEYFAKNSVDYCIFFYSESENYFIPLTLYPRLVYSDYFCKNYQMEHVFRHRSIFPDRGLHSEKYMLLFSKRKKPLKKKESSYNLRKYINICFESGHFTDLQCNLNGLRRGQFIGTSSFPPVVGDEKLSSANCLEQIVVNGKSEALPVQLNGQRPIVSFKLKKPVRGSSYSVWSHVKLSTLIDYDKVKMRVFMTDSRGLRTIVSSSKSPATILSAGSPVDAWLPVTCNVFTGVDQRQRTDDWQVEIAATIGAAPIYVDKPVLLNDPLWSQSRFKEF